MPSEIVQAAHVLARLGLVTAFGHVSVRAGATMLITPATDLAEVGDDSLIEIALDAGSLPAGAPAESWIHLAVYARRADAGAIARAHPQSAYAAAAIATELAPLHGQATWLGRMVPVHDDARLLRSPELAAAAAASLPEGEALLLRGNGAVTLGRAPGIAVARMWLLSTAGEIWLSTSGSPRRGLTDAEIDSWRATQDELLPRLWRYLQRTSSTS